MLWIHVDVDDLREDDAHELLVRDGASAVAVKVVEQLAAITCMTILLQCDESSLCG